MKYDKAISNKLNELIEKNMNAKDGYEMAIEKVSNGEIKEFFKSRAVECARFVKELRTEVWSNGEIPENSGSIKGELHRNWMSLKALFSSNNEEAILEETIRGEKHRLEEYDHILSLYKMPMAVTHILNKQRQAINDAMQKAKYFEAVLS